MRKPSLKIRLPRPPGGHGVGPSNSLANFRSNRATLFGEVVGETVITSGGLFASKGNGTSKRSMRPSALATYWVWVVSFTLHPLSRP